MMIEHWSKLYNQKFLSSKKRCEQGRHHNEERDDAKILMEQAVEFQNMVVEAENIPIEEVDDNKTMSQEIKYEEEQAVSTTF